MEGEVEKILKELQTQAEERVKQINLPIPKQPEGMGDIQLPSELATVSDNDLDNLYDKFTAAIQYIHFAEELYGAELEMAQHNYDLEYNIRLATTTEGRKDIMLAKIITEDKGLKVWLDIISTLKIQCKLTSGISKGYKSAIRRIQSEKIERASMRKHGIL